MAIFSRLAAGISRTLAIRGTIQNTDGQKRNMSKIMRITATRFQYRKFKDLCHFYVMLGAIPVAIIVFYVNVFIGPATLKEIPEGYTPHHWEYYQHPITRWLAKNAFTNPQQEYEKYLHLLYEEDEKMKIRQLQDKVTKKMQDRSDYQGLYYERVTGKYARISKQSAEKLMDAGGYSRTEH